MLYSSSIRPVAGLIANLFLWYSLKDNEICERESYVLVALYLIFLFVTLSGYLGAFA